MADDIKNTAGQADGGALATPRLTAEQIEAQYPDIVAAFVNRGKAAGAEAECKRIKDVEAQALPGHEKLIAEMKYDGKTTGAEAAIKVLSAERTNRAGELAALAKNSPKPVEDNFEAQVEDPDDKPTVIDADGNVNDDGLKALFESSAEIRDEFGNDKKEDKGFSVFKAFMINAGKKDREKYLAKK